MCIRVIGDASTFLWLDRIYLGTVYHYCRKYVRFHYSLAHLKNWKLRSGIRSIMLYPIPFIDCILLKKKLNSRVCLCFLWCSYDDDNRGIESYHLLYTLSPSHHGDHHHDGDLSWSQILIMRYHDFGSLYYPIVVARGIRWGSFPGWWGHDDMVI